MKQQNHHGLRGWLWLGLFTLLSITLAGCRPVAASDSTPSRLTGRILVWHSWSGADTAVLNDLVTNFQVLHPNSHIILQYIPPAQLQADYLRATPLGFGPDLLIAPSELMLPLSNAGTLRDITPEIDAAYRQNFLPQSVALGERHGRVHAIPLALRPMGLFYNQRLIPTLPSIQTYDSLVLEASNGRPLGLNINPEPAYMGIGAFGPGMFTADGRLAATQPGLTNWLTWLSNNNQRRGVIITQDEILLKDRFMNEQLAYYPGFYDDWAEFSQALDVDGEEVVAIAPLPQGPFGQSRPLLRAELMFFNPTSSHNQYETALALARFLTNPEQSRRLMRETRRVPANQLVRVDAAVYPQIAAFAAQGRTAVAIPPAFRPHVLSPLTAGLYTSVLSGVSTPTQAVCGYQASLIANMQGRPPDLTNCATD